MGPQFVSERPARKQLRGMKAASGLPLHGNEP